MSYDRDCLSCLNEHRSSAAQRSLISRARARAPELEKRIQAALSDRKRTGEGVRGQAQCSGSATALSPRPPREAASAQVSLGLPRRPCDWCPVRPQPGRPLTINLIQRNKIVNQTYGSYHVDNRDCDMSDERTITKAVGLSLTAVFVVILILGAISY